MLGPAARSPFTPVETRREMLSLLGEGAHLEASAIVWDEAQTEIVRGHLLTFEPDPGVLIVHRNADSNWPEARGTNCYFSLSLIRAYVFFRARFIGASGKTLRFRAPEQVFKVQRRKDIRIRVSAPHKLEALFVDPFHRGRLIRRPITDLSASGLAFSISEKEFDLWHPDQRIERISFTINGSQVETNAVVRSIRKSSGKPREGFEHVVGVEFQGIAPGRAQVVARFVFDETRRLFSRLL